MKADYIPSQFKKTKNNIIGNEPRFFQKINNFVGPGNYETQTIFADRHNGQRNIYWNKDSRFREKKSDVPGPG